MNKIQMYKIAIFACTGFKCPTLKGYKISVPVG